MSSQMGVDPGRSNPKPVVLKENKERRVAALPAELFTIEV